MYKRNTCKLFEKKNMKIQFVMNIFEKLNLCEY